MFPSPLVAVGGAFCKYTRDVSTWAGVKFLSTLITKWMDCGTIDLGKFIELIHMNGDIEDVDIQVELQDLEKREWIVLTQQTCQLQNWVLQEGFKVRIILIADSYFHISRIRIIGDPGGLAL